MKRKFKSLGLVLAAVFAMSAIGASAASAAEFHAESTGTITGEQSTGHVFTTNAGTVTCTKAHFEGAITSTTTSTQKVHPTYESCKAFGFINVPIHTTGCDFVFTGDTSSNIKADVVCAAGSKIEITAPGCTTTVEGYATSAGPPHVPGVNQGLTTNTVTNHGAGSSRHVTVHTNISGITYNECGTHRTNGTYKGSTTIFGKTAGGAANGIWYT